LSLLGRGVDLGRQPAPGTAQGVIVRLGNDAAGRLDLLGAVAAGAGRVVVST
jgi:hypothetical protein